MYKDKNILALIPARGGSKSILNKNIIDIGGFPLIAYSIAAAKMSKYISRIIVSTDSEKIAEVAKQYGAEVPFMRPAEFATDTAVDFDVVRHSVEWLRENEQYESEYIVFLRPTTPLRDPSLIDRAIEDILSHKEATCLRSGHETRESPYKLFEKEGDFFVGLFPNDPRPEYYNLPRQSFPPAYQPDGYVDIWKRQTIIDEKMLHGEKILGFVAPNTGELDNPDDLEFIQFHLEKDQYVIYDYLKKNFKF
ncbi:acylneuraminate cytidylyltransferase family protein [Patescibacteria group bacterium]|nr:acylneuraminate cytidylyltransferase family protein [Patescibacteria group bacterium]